MVYETDFYTVRRPYTRPTITSYSVTGYRPCVWKTSQISPLGAHSKVRLSVLLGELNRIQNRPRMHLGYVPTEDFLNSRPLVDFDDETKYIRAEADKLLRYIYVPVPHQKLAPKITTSYDRLSSNGVLPYSRSRDISSDIINMSYYSEPTRTTIGRGHLACITFAGGRGYPRRKHLFSDEYRDIGDEIKVRSYYNQNRQHPNRIDEALALPTGFASRLLRSDWKPYSILEEERKLNKTMKIKKSDSTASKTEKPEKSLAEENVQIKNKKINLEDKKLIEKKEEISIQSKNDETNKMTGINLMKNEVSSTVEEKSKLKKESRKKSTEKLDDSGSSTKKVIAQNKPVKEEEIVLPEIKSTDTKKLDTEENMPEKKPAIYKPVDKEIKIDTEKKDKKQPKEEIKKSESIDIEKPKTDNIPEKKIEKIPDDLKKSNVEDIVKPKVVKSEEELIKAEEKKPVEIKPEEVKAEEKSSEEIKPVIKAETVKPEDKQAEIKPDVKPDEIKSEIKQEVLKSEEVKTDEKKLDMTKVEEKEPEEIKEPVIKLDDVKVGEKITEIPIEVKLEETESKQLPVQDEIKPTSEEVHDKEVQKIDQENVNKKEVLTPSIDAEKHLDMITTKTNLETENDKLIIDTAKLDNNQQIIEIQDDDNQTIQTSNKVLTENKTIIDEDGGQNIIESIQIIETNQSIITTEQIMCTNIADEQIEAQPIIEEPLSPEEIKTDPLVK